ncbi:MAG: SpoIIE family protein phosphatase [Leptospiraceae bacterium]|nr:SpoIIE family protein phosphatase [Leptospiraceae bacterium]
MNNIPWISSLFRDSKSIKSKLTLTISFVVILLITISSIFFTMMLLSELRRSLVKRGVMITRSMALVSENLIASFNFSEVERGAAELVDNDREIVYVILESGDGNIIVSRDKTSISNPSVGVVDKEISKILAEEDGNVENMEIRMLDHNDMECIDVMSLIKAGDKTIAKLRIGLTTRFLNLSLLKSIFIAIGMIIIFSLMGIFISIRFSLHFSTPILNLKTATEEMQNKNFDYKIEVLSNDEIGLLADAFDEMRVSIKSYSSSLKELNQNLEIKVDERTRELQNVLHEVNILHEQKKGDYYLTANLLQPLIGNFIENSNVKIEYLINQKMKFEFRNAASQIGGDFILADNLRLGSKNYRFLCNADAMGKSMQGAGGALIFGSVIRSILNRTQYTDHLTEVTKPNEWLEDCYIELVKVFYSMQGTMSVSCILALLDDQTGSLFSLNAGHPPLILYRDGKANFLDEEFVNQKIGESFAYEKIRKNDLKISKVLLRRHDRLLFGSDGKDDILLISNDVSRREINANDRFFLECLEEANGDLHKVLSCIEKRGTLMDDFSLLSIEFINPMAL